MSEIRARLLTAAADLFCSQGYDATGVQEVCDAVGVQKPTLYHYFGSKRGLLETLVSERYAPLLAELRVVAVYRGDLASALRRAIETYASFARSDPSIARAAVGWWFAPPESDPFALAQALHDEQLGILEQLYLGAGVSKPAENARLTLGGITAGIALLLVEHPQLPATLVRQLGDRLLNGVVTGD